MSRRGKRGVASCSKKMSDDELHIEFDEDMIPVGSNKGKFSSWLGLHLRKRFPYHIATNKFEKHMWEDLWLDVKKHWKILDDKPKELLIKKAKKNCTDWRSKLVRGFVNKNKHPFAKYHYLDQSKWDEFVASKTSDEFKKKRNKAKLSARKNKDHPRTGRTGYSGLKEKFANIWTQLLESYPYLEEIENDRTQRWVASRAKLNKQAGLYEVEHLQETIIDLILIESEMKADGTYYEGRDDPITRYFGPEHGGRTRMVSAYIGSTKVRKGLYKSGRQQNQNDVPTTQIRSEERERQRADTSPGFRSSSCALGGSHIDYPDIQRPEQELGDRNATHEHDAGSGLTTLSEAARISDVIDSRGKRFRSSAGAGNTRDANIPVEHEIIITQSCESEDGTNHQKRKRGRPLKSVVKKSTGLLEGSKRNKVIVSDDIPQDSPPVEHEIIITARESENGTSHQKKKRRTTPKSVVEKPTGLLEGSSSLSPPDHYGISLLQPNAGTTTDYQQDWPFIKRSPMWAIIELYSQKPHFAPLKEMKEDCREGSAIAHIVTFGNLVQRLSDFKPNDPADKFHNSLETLSDLETHGFDVGPIRRRLNQLLSLKTKMCQQEDTRKEVEKELENGSHEKSLVAKEMDELKEKMRALKSKSEQIVTMQKAKEKELMWLQTSDLELDFEVLAATPL